MQKPDRFEKTVPTRKRRRHAYRGYGSPSWEVDRDNRGHWGRWFGGVLLPDAGIPAKKPVSETVFGISFA